MLDDNEPSNNENRDMFPKMSNEIDNNDTAILPADVFKKVRRSGDTNQLKHYTDAIQSKHEIVLLIRGMVERVELANDEQLVLGRVESRQRHRIELDLTQYGAVDRGVSREHCALYFQNGAIYISDLASTNGTFINGSRLSPHIPQQLNKGDELILGRLIIQVLFR
jgi:pSer/pThr/pTyr-binding forkhead associated (FHA) protein